MDYEYDVEDFGWSEYECEDTYDCSAMVDTEMIDMSHAQANDNSVVTKNKAYTMLDFDEIHLKIMQKVDTIVDQIGLSKNLAFAMVVRNSFSEQTAIDRYLDDPDYIEKTFRFKQVNKPFLPLEPDFLCGICFCPCEEHEVIGIEDCGHACCKECYGEYLKSRLGDGHECVGTYCPDQKCNMVVPEHFFKVLLEEESYKKYKQFLF